MLQVQVTGTDAMRAKLQRVGDALTKQALASTAVEVEDYVAREAGKHNKTGALVRSIYKTPIPGGWEIGHDLQHAPHALFVHWGTRPHIIKPKNKKALRWAAGGAFAFAPKIKHPGNAPDKWMERAAAIAPKLFQQHVETLLNKA